MHSIVHYYPGSAEEYLIAYDNYGPIICILASNAPCYHSISQ